MKKNINFATATAMGITADNRCEIKSVKPENVFHFKEGIVGFEEHKDYVFLLNDTIKPFMFMQSLTDSNLSFVCVKTDLVCPDYEITLPKANVQFLELEKPEDTLILSLVTVRPDVTDTTANLMSPIVINMQQSLGQQIILERSPYPVRYKVWDAIERNAMMINAG